MTVNFSQLKINLENIDEQIQILTPKNEEWLAEFESIDDYNSCITRYNAETD